jgi:hypothetical protein
MIEAVNSAIAASSVLKGLALHGLEPPPSAQGRAQVAQTIEAGQAPRAPFVSPMVYMNLDYNKAVLQIRDSETGDVVNQIPSDNRLAAQQRTILAEEDLYVAARQATGSDEVREATLPQAVVAPEETAQAARTDNAGATTAFNGGDAQSGDSAQGTTEGANGGVSILA